MFVRGNLECLIRMFVLENWIRVDTELGQIYTFFLLLVQSVSLHLIYVKLMCLAIRMPLISFLQIDKLVYTIYPTSERGWFEPGRRRRGHHFVFVSRLATTVTIVSSQTAKPSDNDHPITGRRDCRTPPSSKGQRLQIEIGHQFTIISSPPKLRKCSNPLTLCIEFN